MIRYIASDLDGTLLADGAQNITPEIFDLILKLKKQGVQFIAASGRQYHSIRRLFNPVKDMISYITENGSLCIHEGQVVSRGLIGRALGLEIIQAGREYGDCHTLLSCESRHYTDSKNDAFIYHMRNVLHNDIAVVDDLCQVEEPFLKLAICDFHGTQNLDPFLKERFSDKIRVVTAGREWVDFLAPDADKGKALAALLAHLGIPAEDGIAFGDQYNDIEMLRFAGIGYAMETAAPGVADYADRVTGSVAEVLETIIETGEVRE